MVRHHPFLVGRDDQHVDTTVAGADHQVVAGVGFRIQSNAQPFRLQADAAADFGGVFADASSFNKRVHLVWIGLGTAEPTPFPASIKAFRDSLDKGGIRHVYFESAGTAHEWLTWRRSLNDFAPRLFK